MRAKFALTILLLALFMGSVSGLQFTTTPDDIEITTTESATLTWVIDETGVEYEITMSDGSTEKVVASGTTNNETVSLDVSNLPVGTYNFTLRAGTLVDSVVVTVTSGSETGSDTGTTEVTPFPVFSVFILLGTVGILRRKK